MTTRRQLTDLLPIFFASAVERFNGRALLELERESVFLALLNSLRWSVVRRARERRGESVKTIETGDRFADAWVSRGEIVSRVEHTSGLGPTLSHLALMLIEIQLDTALVADEEGTVIVEGVGSVRSRATERRLRERDFGEMNMDVRRLSERFLYSLTDERESFWRPRPLNRAFVRQWVGTLEAWEAFRAPAPYSIELAPSLALLPTVHATGEEVEWPLTGKTWFLGRGVKRVQEKGKDDSDHGLLKT